jgi:hypothetical protein
LLNLSALAGIQVKVTLEELEFRCLLPFLNSFVLENTAVSEDALGAMTFMESYIVVFLEIACDQKILLE